MAQKPKIGKNPIPINSNLGCILSIAETCQPIELKSCSSPIKMRKVL